jgi:hypothetical protein
MNAPDPAEDIIGTALAEISEEDRRSAPPFARVVAGRDRRSARPRLSLGRLATTIGVLLVAGPALIRLERATNTPVRPSSDVEALTAWRPNSDVLLRDPAMDVSRLELEPRVSALDTLAGLADPSSR